jgi:hypothetical protein
MSNYLGLYFPFIHFRNEAWLKLTSLYWDRMGRIVPAEYGLRDSDTVREFKEGDYVVDYQPTGNAQAETARAFHAVISTHGDRLVNRYGLRLSPNWPDDAATVRSKAAHFGNPKLAYVFSPKLSPSLIDDLEALGLAERGGQRDPHWIGMHPKLAAIYMTALAERMATRRNALPVGDDILSHVCVGVASMEGMAEALFDDEDQQSLASSHEAEMLMASLAIKTVAPANPEAIPARTFLEFRNRYASERAAFQDQVKAMVASLDLANISEPDALREHLRIQYEKQLEPHVADLKHRLGAACIDTMTTVFNVKAYLGVTGGSVALTMLNEPLIGTGAIALGVWSVYRSHRRTRRAILAKHGATSYLYRIDNLSPQHLAGRIARLGLRIRQ